MGEAASDTYQKRIRLCEYNMEDGDRNGFRERKRRIPVILHTVRNERRHGWDGWSVGIIVLFVTNRSADPTKVGGGGKKVV